MYASGKPEAFFLGKESRCSVLMGLYTTWMLAKTISNKCYHSDSAITKQAPDILTLSMRVLTF